MNEDIAQSKACSFDFGIARVTRLLAVGDILKVEGISQEASPQVLKRKLVVDNLFPVTKAKLQCKYPAGKIFVR
jgi:hypothetical protein